MKQNYFCDNINLAPSLQISDQLFCIFTYRVILWQLTNSLYVCQYVRYLAAGTYFAPGNICFIWRWPKVINSHLTSRLAFCTCRNLIHHHILLHVNTSYFHAHKFLHYRHNSHWIHVCNTRGLSTCDVCLQADCGVFRYYEKVQALLQWNYKQKIKIYVFIS